jgi:hypothetical protein
MGTVIHTEGCFNRDYRDVNQDSIGTFESVLTAYSIVNTRATHFVVAHVMCSATRRR